MAAAYAPYGLSHAERSRHAITSLHLANHYPEAGLAAEKVQERRPHCDGNNQGHCEMIVMYM